MDRIGIFLRCVGIEDIPTALRTIHSDLGTDLIQISKLPDLYYTPEGIDELARLLENTGMRAGAITIVHEGESYVDIETIRRTVGYLPPETLDRRLHYSRLCVDMAARLAIPIVTTHMGFLPPDSNDAGYRRLLDAVREIATYAAEHGVTLALETGQETAEELMAFLEQIKETRVGVNYDPANLIMYGMDDPVGSLHILLERIIGVHVKDAVPPEMPGQLGREVRPGQGAAAIGECIRYLNDTGYSGSFIVENYVARHGSVADKLNELRIAIAFVGEMLSTRQNAGNSTA